MKCYPEMNAKIVSILRIDYNNPTGLYAAARIEELEAEAKTLREALEKIRDAKSESCRRCEGSGALYADGKAHYPSEKASTRSCPQCGGEGRTPPDDCQEIARAALAAHGGGAKGEQGDQLRKELAQARIDLEAYEELCKIKDEEIARLEKFEGDFIKGEFSG